MENLFIPNQFWFKYKLRRGDPCFYASGSDLNACLHLKCSKSANLSKMLTQTPNDDYPNCYQSKYFCNLRSLCSGVHSDQTSVTSHCLLRFFGFKILSLFTLKRAFSAGPAGSHRRLCVQFAGSFLVLLLKELLIPLIKSHRNNATFPQNWLHGAMTLPLILYKLSVDIIRW